MLPRFRRARAVWFAWSVLCAAAAGAAEPIESAPLAPRSGPRGATLFAVVPSSQTGVVVENNYADPKMWAEHYQELVFGEMGTGIAIGDYDNDGRPDLFVVSKTEGARLFRNLGHWKFEDVTEKSGLAGPTGVWDRSLAQAKSWFGANDATGDRPEFWKQGAVFVDVNNDGWLDLYVCRFGAPNLLYVNQHDGTFKEEAAARGLAVKDASGMGEFCDYDGDGWLDVFVHTNMLDAAAHPNGQRSYLFHNNGDGTFADVTARAGLAGEAATHSATWWDYDQDGRPDLYVANDYGTPDALYHNRGDGTFENVIDRVVPRMPYYSMGADLGDVNNDGKIDLFVADMAATSHEKDQRGMAGARARTHDDPKDPRLAPQYMRNALYVNPGVGVMLEAANLAGIAATDWTWSPRFEDVDDDGRLDLIVTNGMIREYHNADLLEKVMAVESLQGQRQMVRQSPVLAERNRAFRNLGALQFEDVSAAWGLDELGVSFGSALGDLDGDGDLDLVYGNYQKNVTLLRNDEDRGHRLIVALRGTRSNKFGIGALVRIETVSGVQIRPLVAARGYLSGSEPIVHFGLGDADRILRLTVVWPSGATQSFPNLDADRRYLVTEPAADVASAAPRVERRAPPQFADVSESVHFAIEGRENAARPAELQPLLPQRFDRRGPTLAAADLDADGRVDLVLGATSLSPRRVLFRDGTAAFAARDVFTGGIRNRLEDGPMALADFDGDGAPDLLVTKQGANLPAGAAAYEPELWLNDGPGNFRAAAADALPTFGGPVGAVAVADFDRDGHLDVFVGGRLVPGKYPLPAASALWRNRGGRFEDVTDIAAPALRAIGLVTAALATDVDADGWIDLLVATEWGSVRYLHNDGGHGFEDWTERAGFAAAGTGWWTALAAADFNGDGRLDYVVGNVGLNTPYHASPLHPALLFYGVFGDGGAPQLIEADYEGDRLYPWRTRQDLGAKIPGVLKRIPGNDAYARAELSEIVGADRLAKAQRFAATELRSGVFLSQPDGTYRFEPLPRIAQIAPFQGLLAGDFDGDGCADIYAVQNSYSPIPYVGRLTGGVSQLLRGDGQGHFTAVPPETSGLVVTGDAKALAAVDLNGDGWPDFLITRNNATTLAYENRGSRHGSRMLGVKLIGPAGNGAAIGARVRLELTDGRSQIAELACGGAFAAQATGECFFGYADTNPPRRIVVRWPNGRETTHVVPADVHRLEVVAPAEAR